MLPIESTNEEVLDLTSPQEPSTLDSLEEVVFDDFADDPEGETVGKEGKNDIAELEKSLGRLRQKRGEERKALYDALLESNPTKLAELIRENSELADYAKRRGHKPEEKVKEIENKEIKTQAKNFAVDFTKELLAKGELSKDEAQSFALSQIPRVTDYKKKGLSDKEINAILQSERISKEEDLSLRSFVSSTPKKETPKSPYDERFAKAVSLGLVPDNVRAKYNL